MDNLLCFALGALLGSLATLVVLAFLFGIAEHKDNKDININE